MQTAVIHPAYSTMPITTQQNPGLANALPDGAFPLSADQRATPVMTQMPTVPQPPFLNQAPKPLTSIEPSPPASAGGISEIPPPWQLAPALFNTNKSQVMTPAQSIGFSGPVPPEIPPPHMIAPYLYLQTPKNLPAIPPQAPMQAASSGINGNDNLNKSLQSQQQQSQQPPQPPQQQPPPPQQPAQPPQQKGPTEPLEDSGLDDAKIRSLNNRLNDPDEGVRADAGMDLYKILETNPKLTESPVYRPYVDAFLEKIMKDPSALVRASGEIMMQMGKVFDPSETVKSQLKNLSQKDSLTGESDIASSILGGADAGTLKKPDKKKSKSPSQEQPENPSGKEQENNGPNGSTQQPMQNPQGQLPQGNAMAPPVTSNGYPSPPTSTPPGVPPLGAVPPLEMPPPAALGATSMQGGYPPNPQVGNQLNYTSPPQYLLSAGLTYPPTTGQKLNLQEGR